MKRRHVDPEQLLERLGVRFTRRGLQLWASCPHPRHDDRTPSWRMLCDPQHPKFGQHRCYGCGWGGWPVHLVETLLQCSREHAWAWLADIEDDPPVPFAVQVDYQRGSPLQSVFRLPPGVQVVPYEEWPPAPRDYVVQRGITDWQVERWGVGYAGTRWHKFLNPLAGRVVFPVRTAAGRIVSYTGRTYVGAARRYKEPGRAERADLGAVFGELYWPPPEQRRVVVVTEGAIDALAVERAMPALALGGIFGSQLHQGHIARLATFGYVVMATDPDPAGNRVAVELEAQLRRWTRVVRLELPPGEDCASAAPTALKDAIESALRVVYRDRDWRVVAPRQRPWRRRTEAGIAVRGRQRDAGG